MISILFSTLFWAWFGSEILVAALTPTWRGKGQVRDRGSMLLLWFVIAGFHVFGRLDQRERACSAVQ